MTWRTSKSVMGDRSYACTGRLTTSDGGHQYFVESINGRGTWALIPQAFKQELRDNARTLLGQLNDQRQPYRRAEAEAISLPTLFVLGEKTRGTLPVVLRALAAAVPG